MVVKYEIKLEAKILRNIIELVITNLILSNDYKTESELYSNQA